MSALVIEPAIKDAYELVRADDDPADWLLCTYEDQKKDVLKLTSKGEGGLEGLKKELKDDAAGWGYVAMGVGNDELSIRRKFVLITWTPANIGVMRRAKCSVHISDVKQVMPVFGVEVPASSLQDLDYASVETKVKKSMGANYDGQGATKK